MTLLHVGVRPLQVTRIGSPLPNAGEGSCEKIENRLLSTLSVRRSARSTQVERALRARFRLWIQNRDGSGLSRFNFFTASGEGSCENLWWQRLELRVSDRSPFPKGGLEGDKRR